MIVFSLHIFEGECCIECFYCADNKLPTTYGVIGFELFELSLFRTTVVLGLMRS